MMHKAAVNVLILLWLMAVTRLAQATTLTQEFMAYDYASLTTAAIAGLCGGALRTIFTLASDNRAVFVVLKEARRDLIVSAMAGGAVYVALAALESVRPGTVTRELRFLLILAAGWIGTGVFNAVGRLGRAKVDGLATKFQGGAALPKDPPVSADVPLGRN